MPRGYLKHRNLLVGSKRSRGGSSHRSNPNKSQPAKAGRKKRVSFWDPDDCCNWECNSGDEDSDDLNEFLFEQDSLHRDGTDLETASVSDLCQSETRSATTEGFVPVCPQSDADSFASSWDILEDNDDEAYSMLSQEIASQSAQGFDTIRKTAEKLPTTSSTSIVGKVFEEQTPVNKCYLCHENCTTAKLFKRCKHTGACYECLRKYYLTDIYAFKYPLQCFGSSCDKDLTVVQVCPILQTSKELERYYLYLINAPFVCDLFLQEDWARCPGCRMVIFKDMGCNHMDCVCGTTFDWSSTREQRMAKCHFDLLLMTRHSMMNGQLSPHDGNRSSSTACSRPVGKQTVHGVVLENYHGREILTLHSYPN